jgi:hypothetical protein
MALAADVVLGLTAKVEQVFAGGETDLGDDTFLSFPVASMVAFPAAHLADLGRPSPTAAAAQTAADFSRIVNMVPRGRLWRSAPDPTLWGVLSRVLTDAEVATVTPTESERTAYEAARRLLYDIGDDGSIAESQALLTYRQHRDAWFVAQAEYANRRGPAELAGGEELARFQEVDGPQLRAAITEIELAWEVAGRRSDIEAAQHTVRTLNERSPATAWGGFLARFDPSLPDLSLYTAPDGARYAPTGLLPAAVAETAWPEIRLDRAQLDALAASADDELRQALGGDSDRSVVEVSFEYTSASLQRPWFSSELFDARYWRLPTSSEELSDGGQPPQGLCPAYVTAVVLARNVVVRRTITPGKSAGPKPDLGFLGGARLRPVAAPTPADLRVTQAVTAALPQSARVSGAREPRAGTVARDHRTATVRDHRTAKVRDHRTATVRDHRSISGAVAAPFIVRLPLEQVLIERPVPELAEPDDGWSTEETPADETYVLAFIAKRLGRTPDPDPKLFPSAAVSGLLADSKTDSALAYNQRQGFTTEETELIQRVIGVKTDGTWGPRTVQGVARWQEANDIPVDGKVRRHPEGDTWPRIQAAARSMA